MQNFKPRFLTPDQGDRIRAAIQRRGMEFVDFARSLRGPTVEYPDGHLRAVLRGRAALVPDYARRLAKAFGLALPDLERLIDRDEDVVVSEYESFAVVTPTRRFPTWTPE